MKACKKSKQAVVTCVLPRLVMPATSPLATLLLCVWPEHPLVLFVASGLSNVSLLGVFFVSQLDR